MSFLRKRSFLLIALLLVYSAFFFTHLHHTRPTPVLGVSTNLFLFEEPVAGKDPIVSAINMSTKEVDMEVYLLSDKDVVASLFAACQRGVVVRVMLEEHPFGGGNVNQKSKQAFDNSCVHMQWTNPAYSLTHEKTIVVDNSEVFILNQNLTTSSFTKNREFDVVDANSVDILEIKKIFDADWNRTSFSQTNDNLVVSPNSSREKLSALLSSSTKNIDIEMEVVDDPDIIHLLKSKANTVIIRLIIPSISQISANKKAMVLLQQSGILVKTLKIPYIHAKLILVDDKKAYIGSINFTTQSMDSNREVGIILSQQDSIGQLNQDFSEDWEKATQL
ncbi:MAG TPA: phospholipase D-like domain-containing protein [Candidatus Eisenbacteria bacterium]|nr:phospholipase D-like domain-containing protein [Candidatus Eisenbacteria bacterium]